MLPAVAVSEFVNDPLTVWFLSCLDDSSRPKSYHDIIDGSLIHKVFLQFHPEPVHGNITDSESDPTLRVSNLHKIIENLKCFYRNELGQLLLQVPDADKLGRDPDSRVGDAKFLLLLLFGSAVQSSKKEVFIENIKKLPNYTRVAMNYYIKKNSQDYIVSKENIASDTTGSAFTLIESLVEERNMYRKEWEATVAAYTDERQKTGCADSEKDEKLDEGNPKDLLQAHNILKQYKSSIDKLKLDNILLGIDVKRYKDDLDATMKQVERSKSLENEVRRYQDILKDPEMCKMEAKELQGDNRVLLKNKKLFDDQLATATSHADNVINQESEVSSHGNNVDNTIAEQEVYRGNYERRVIDENSCIQNICQEISDMSLRLLMMRDVSVSEQLNSINEVSALNRELDDQKLQQSLAEESKELSKRLLELETERENHLQLITSFKKETIQMNRKYFHLDAMYTEAFNENEKLQCMLDTQHEMLESLEKEIETKRIKIQKLEKCCASETVENEALQLLSESRQEQENVLNTYVDDVNMKPCKRSGEEISELRRKYAKLKNNYNHLRRTLTNYELQSNGLNAQIVELKNQLTTIDTKYSNCKKMMKNVMQRWKSARAENIKLSHDKQYYSQQYTVLYNEYQEFLVKSVKDRQLLLENREMEENMYSEKLSKLRKQKNSLENKVVETVNELQKTNKKKKVFVSGLVKGIGKAIRQSDVFTSKVISQAKYTKHIDEPSFSSSVSDMQNQYDANDEETNVSENADNADNAGNISTVTSLNPTTSVSSEKLLLKSVISKRSLAYKNHLAQDLTNDTNKKLLREKLSDLASADQSLGNSDDDLLEKSIDLIKLVDSESVLNLPGPSSSKESGTFSQKHSTRPTSSASHRLYTPSSSDTDITVVPRKPSSPKDTKSQEPEEPDGWRNYGRV